MSVFYFIFLVLIYLILFGAAISWKSNPPEMSGTFGYRTKNSMRSQETWDYAHRYFGKLCAYFALPSLALSSLIFFLTPVNDILKFLISVFILLITVIIMIFITEYKLKHNSFK